MLEMAAIVASIIGLLTGLWSITRKILTGKSKEVRGSITYKTETDDRHASVAIGKDIEQTTIVTGDSNIVVMKSGSDVSVSVTPLWKKPDTEESSNG